MSATVLPFRRDDELCTACGVRLSKHFTRRGQWVGCSALPVGDIRRRLRETLARCAAVNVILPSWMRDDDEEEVAGR